MLMINSSAFFYNEIEGNIYGDKEIKQQEKIYK